MNVEPVTADPPTWNRREVLHQRWDELAYFHWPYDPQVVQRLLPDGLQVDVFDGEAWVGLIPFEMRRVRLGPTPPIPYLGAFVEVNVRTDVIDPHGRRAVWFFSLDVPRSLIVAVARTVFALPYCWARAEHTVDGADHRYSTRRRRPHGQRPTSTIAFRVGDRIPADQVSDLAHFLTARWALATTRGSRLQYGAVHHGQWPVHRIDDYQIDDELVVAAGLPAPIGEPHAMYSPGVAVDLAWLERIER